MSANPGTSEEIEELENSTENPWLVENIQAFSFLNCPECAFKVKEVGIFQDHAVRNHPQSSVLFGPNVKSEFIAVKTEQNSEISVEHPIIDPLESVMNQECALTEIETEEVCPIAMDEQSVNQTETLSKNLDQEMMDISKAPEPVKKKVVINATIELLVDGKIPAKKPMPLKKVFPKGFPCSYCPKKFSQKNNLRVHMKEKHKEQLLQWYEKNSGSPNPIPTFSVNNLSRKAQDIFKESIGKESERVSNNVCNPDQLPIQPNSEISSEGVLPSNSDEINEFKITIDEQNIDPLKLSKEIEIAKLQIENLTSNRQRRNVFDKTSKLKDQNDIDETQVAYRDRHFISHEGKEHLTCFPCHICTKVFQTKFDVNSHIASVH